MELWFNILLSILFLFFSIVCLKKRQRNCGYLLPGWIIVILIFIYSVPAAFVYAINPVLINSTFNRSFSYDSVWGCQQCFTVVLAAYLLSELIVSKKSRSSRGKYEFISQDIEQKNFMYKMYIIILFALSVWLYIQRWSSVGGVGAMIYMGRADALYEMGTGGGGFARYDIFLFLSSSFYLSYIITRRKRRDMGFILIMGVLYAVLFIVMLMAGTRLPIVSIFLAALALIFTFSKDWLKRNKRLIITSGIFFYLIFNVYSFFRSDVFNIVDNVSNAELTAVEILLPNETLTSYLSYDAMIEYPEVFYENQFFKIIPSTIRRFIGLGTYEPYSARLQDLQQTVSTLTVPLPIDLYFGTRGVYVFMFMIALFTFLIIDRIYVFFSHKRYGTLLMLWTYLISFYFIRTEAIAWFSRGILLFLFGLPLIFALKKIRNK